MGHFFSPGARSFGLVILYLTYFKASSQLVPGVVEMSGGLRQHAVGLEKAICPEEHSHAQLLRQGIFPGMLWALFSLYPPPT